MVAVLNPRILWKSGHEGPMISVAGAGQILILGTAHDFGRCVLPCLRHSLSTIRPGARPHLFYWILTWHCRARTELLTLDNLISARCNSTRQDGQLCKNVINVSQGQLCE